jgi:hypothetical protein
LRHREIERVTPRNLTGTHQQVHRQMPVGCKWWHHIREISSRIRQSIQSVCEIVQSRRFFRKSGTNSSTVGYGPDVHVRLGAVQSLQEIHLAGSMARLNAVQ